MSHQIVSNSVSLQHTDPALFHQGFVPTSNLINYQAHELVQQITLGKRPLSPGSDGMEDRQSDPEQTNETSIIVSGARAPSTLRNTTIRKRYRREEAAKRSLSYLLDSLQRDQLLEVIDKVTENDPSLRSDFLAAVPRPTLQSVSFAFSNLEKRVYAAFPYSRDGPGRDRYSFTRVKPKLMELKESVFQYADHFVSSESEMPSVIFSFLKLATDLAHRLPDWDHAPNNQFKKEFYAKLIEYWNNTIELAAKKMEEGKLFGQTLVSEWGADLNRHNESADRIFESTIHLFKLKLGWVLGIGALPLYSNFKSHPEFSRNL